MNNHYIHHSGLELDLHYIKSQDITLLLVHAPAIDDFDANAMPDDHFYIDYICGDPELIAADEFSDLLRVYTDKWIRTMTEYDFERILNRQRAARNKEIYNALSAFADYLEVLAVDDLPLARNADRTLPVLKLSIGVESLEVPLSADAYEIFYNALHQLADKHVGATGSNVIAIEDDPLV